MDFQKALNRYDLTFGYFYNGDLFYDVLSKQKEILANTEDLNIQSYVEKKGKLKNQKLKN